MIKKVEICKEEANELTAIKLIEIGNYIKLLRKKYKVSQQDLAFCACSNISMISKLETGMAPNVTINTLIRISMVFNINVNDLFNQT